MNQIFANPFLHLCWLILWLFGLAMAYYLVRYLFACVVLWYWGFQLRRQLKRNRQLKKDVEQLVALLKKL